MHASWGTAHVSNNSGSCVRTVASMGSSMQLLFSTAGSRCVSTGSLGALNECWVSLMVSSGTESICSHLLNSRFSVSNMCKSFSDALSSVLHEVHATWAVSRLTDMMLLIMDFANVGLFGSLREILSTTLSARYFPRSLWPVISGTRNLAHGWSWCTCRCMPSARRVVLTGSRASQDNCTVPGLAPGMSCG